MKTIVLSALFLLIAIDQSYCQDNYPDLKFDEKEFIPHSLDSIQKNMPQKNDVEYKIKVYEPDVDQMAPMPYAKIDTTTHYPMRIKKYEMAQPKKRNEVIVKPLNKNR